MKAGTHLVEVGDGGVSETENAINGVAAEAAGERGHGREVLAGDGDTRDVDWAALSAPCSVWYDREGNSPLSV